MLSLTIHARIAALARAAHLLLSARDSARQGRFPLMCWLSPARESAPCSVGAPTMAATSSRRGRPWPGPHVGPFVAVCGCCLGGCRGAPAHTSAPTAQRPSPGIGRSARSFVESRHAAEGWKRCHDGLTIALCGRRVASPLTTIRRMPHGGRHSSTTWMSSKCHGTRTLLAGRLLGLFSWHPAHVGEQRQTEDAGACPRAICHGKHTALTCTIWCNRRKRNLCSYDTL